eukprot:jgi/Botrbrau1/18965/Bobra.0100s0002.1
MFKQPTVPQSTSVRPPVRTKPAVAAASVPLFYEPSKSSIPVRRVVTPPRAAPAIPQGPLRPGPSLPRPAGVPDPCTLPHVVRPPHWPADVSDPHRVTLGHFGEIPDIREHHVTHPDGTLKTPDWIFNNNVDSYDNLYNGSTVDLAKFARNYLCNVEPIYGPDPLNPGSCIAMKEKLPFDVLVNRMITTQDIVEGKPVVTTVAPQVHYTDKGDLCLTFLNQPNPDKEPVFQYYIVQPRHLNNPESKDLSDTPLHQEDFAENVQRHAKAAADRKVAEFQKNRQANITQFRALAQGQQLAANPPPTYQETMADCMPLPRTASQPAPEPEVQCNMFHADFGPLAGNICDSSLDPLGVNASQGRRPNRAEHFRQQDREGPKPNPPNPYFYSPESRIGNASFVITFLSLVQWCRNPKFPAWIEATNDLIGKQDIDKVAVINMSNALMSIAAEMNIPLVCTLDFEPLQFRAGEPRNPQPHYANCNVHTHVESAVSIKSLDVVPIFSLLSPSYQASVPVEEEDITQQSYLQAALAKVPSLFIPAASMPTVGFQLMDKSGAVMPNAFRAAYLDTGCNVNLMSRRAFARDGGCMGSEAVLHKIKPFHIQLAHGKSGTITVESISKARIVIGKAFYTMDFLIVENLTTDYLIGFSFMFMYNLQIKPANAQLAIGVPQNNMIVKEPYRPYQTLPIKFTTKKLTLNVLG